MPMRVTEVMTKDPVAVRLDVMLTEAAKIMRDHAIGDVLVTSNGHLCGMLTDRDIVVRAVAENRDPRRTMVGEVCSADIVAVERDADTEDAVKLMRARAVRRVPVVERGEPVGIVTIGDLVIGGDEEDEKEEESVLAEICRALPDR
jgi:CBS domain-containing protein